MGIDPGLINTGFGVISLSGTKIDILDYGIISPIKEEPLSMRLNMIYNDVSKLISEYNPDCLSIEEVFYSNNIKTTMKSETETLFIESLLYILLFFKTPYLSNSNSKILFV